MTREHHGVTYYSVSELAEKLGVHRNSVIYWIKTGKINAMRVGLADRSPYQISQNEVERVTEEIASDSS